MKKIIRTTIIIILLFCNYTFAADNISWYGRYEYDSKEIQDLIKQKEKIQKEVNVEPQGNLYDLVIFMGQSNMVGKGGDASKAVKGIEGAGYELEFNTNGTIKGLKPVEEPFGSGENNVIGGSMVTSFMNAYYNNSGTPVIGIAAAYNETSIYDFWQQGQDGLVNAQTKVKAATKWLEENGYKIRHKYMVWDQGEADVSKIEYIDENDQKQTYERALKNTIEAMQDVGIERCFMIRIGTIYLYKGYEEKYKERYYEYLNMVTEQTRIAENNWITLVSTSMFTLSKCEKMMTDMVHFNQEALDIVGSEAGKKAGQYADATRRKTLTQNQSDRLIKFAKEFSEEGFEREKLVYGILSKNKAYNLQLVHYPSPYVELEDGKRLQVINFGSYGKEFGWNGEKTEAEFVPNNYIGLDCSGFISFLYHYVFGLPFDYYYNGRNVPWTTEQFVENKEIDKFDGSGKTNAFKIVYEQHRTEQTYTLNDLATLANLQPGDLLVGMGGKEEGDSTNHIVMYAGIDEHGVDKIIHSTSSPALYNMYVEDENGNKKYYYMGETDLANSTFKYRNVYVLRLNEEILPNDYIYNDKPVEWEKLNTKNPYDNIAPTVTVEYSTKEVTEDGVIVKITANEEVQTIEGWTLESNKNVLTKKYTENTTENIIVKDLSGNETQISIKIENIKKYGDINQDKKIDVTDLLMLKRHTIAGSKESWKLTGNSLILADMNKDTKVDVTDMLMLKRKILRELIL